MTSLQLRSFLFWRSLLLVVMLFPCVSLSHISKTILIRFIFAFSPIIVIKVSLHASLFRDVSLIALFKPDIKL
jgi:hypothetical protein